MAVVDVRWQHLLVGLATFLNVLDDFVGVVLIGGEQGGEGRGGRRLDQQFGPGQQEAQSLENGLIGDQERSDSVVECDLEVEIADP